MTRDKNDNDEDDNDDDAVVLAAKIKVRQEEYGFLPVFVGRLGLGSRRWVGYGQECGNVPVSSRPLQIFVLAG